MYTNLPTILLVSLLALTPTVLAAPGQASSQKPAHHHHSSQIVARAAASPAAEAAAACKAGKLSCSTTSSGTKEILKGNANGKCEHYAYCYAGQGCGFDKEAGKIMCLNP